jgi:DNA polymerase III delta prime subunit
MKKVKVNSIWYKKYQPTDIEKYMGSGVVKNRIKNILTSKNVPHLLFYGPAGTGKSTLALLIAKNVDCDYIYINASDENGIDTIREKVKSFAEAGTFKSVKLIILDESDFLTPSAQAALRNVIDEYDQNTRFILTCNYAEKIIEPLKSRCENHQIKAQSKGEIARNVVHILETEGVSFELEDVAKVIERNYPDVRSTIKELQSSVDENNHLNIDTSDYTKFHTGILDILKSPTSKSWYELRQLVANEQLDDYNPIYRFLYDNLSEFAKGNEAEVIISIDEHLWRSHVIPDKEITLMTMFSKVLKIVSKKQVVYGNK